MAGGEFVPPEWLVREKLGLPEPIPWPPRRRRGLRAWLRRQRYRGRRRLGVSWPAARRPAPAYLEARRGLGDES